MNRLNKLLLLFVVVQVIIVFTMDRHPKNETLNVSLLNGEFVTSIEMSDPNQSVRIEKQGELWILPKSGGVAVKEDQVTALVTRLQETNLSRPIVKNAASHRRLKVAEDEYYRRVVINDKTTFYLGSSPSRQLVHMRIDGQDDVYQVEGLGAWNFGVRANQWVDPKIIEVRKPQIQEFTLTTAEGTFHFSKGADDIYQFHDTMKAPEGQEFDAIAFGIWVNQQGSWGLSDVVDSTAQPEYGLDTPTATLSFQLVPKKDENEETDDEPSEPESFTLVIGAKNPQSNEYYAQASDQNRIVSVPAHRIEKLLERNRQSFYKKVK